MNRASAATLVLALLCLGSLAQADVFSLGPGLTNLETVTVGDPGNAADRSYYAPYYPGFGSVGYTYAVSKYEVTAGQYCDFLNHKAKSDPYGLYNTEMGRLDHCGCNIQRSGADGTYAYTVASDWANRPVNYVSFWDACRFANWLHNGQWSGDTETGAYTLGGYVGADGQDIGRNAGAKWFVTSIDEWYKAAYYKAGATNGGYWTYPTQSDTAPSNDLTDPDPGNNADFVQGYRSSIGSPYFRTEVGEFENSDSAYGTFDQAGNVWEWSETLFTMSYPSERCVWGGSFSYDNSRRELSASGGGGNYPWDEGADLGFRVAAVPEPSSLVALVGGLLSLLSGVSSVGLIRRRRS